MARTAPTDEGALPQSSLARAQAVSGAHDSIIIGGERRQLEGVQCVTFVDDPSWDFTRLSHPDANGSYVSSRRTADKREVVSLADAQTVVDMVVIHSDITIDSRSCFNVLKSRGFSTHFMINWDGTIYQGTDPVRKAIHAASDLRGDVNNFAVGIDFNCLQNNYASSGNPDEAKSSLAGQFGAGHVRRMSDVIEINGVPWRSWGYTDAQYDALIKLLRELNVAFPKLKLAAPIDERGEPIWQVVEALDTEKMGIYGHMHLTPQKFDPGPGMDWPRLLQGLTKEHNSFPVELVKGKSLASLLTEDKVLQLADKYYQNTEADDGGGYYPMGLGGQWHGGVHLHPKKGQEVVAMIDGTVVAARNGPAAELGSNNFVLLRHEVPFDPKDDKKTFVFFSLYMHLLPFDPKKNKTEAQFKAKEQGDDPATYDIAPEWVTNARRINTGKTEDEAAEPEEPKAEDKPKKKGKKAAKTDDDGGKAEDKPKKKAKRGDDDDDGDEPSDEAAPFLNVDKHLSALERGDVALFATDGSDQTRVPAGKAIGRVGWFGEDAEDQGLLHVEVFADGRWRQIVDLLGVHSAHWFELEPDTDDNLVVDTEDLLRKVLPDGGSAARKRDNLFVVSRRRVDEDDVRAFYAGDGDDGGVGRKDLRRAITRHVSEWSDQVDWFKTLAVGQGWEERVGKLTEMLQDEQTHHWRETLFSKQIMRQLPFVWLTEDVAKHLQLDTGKEWTGVLYHFHPIHFVMWLSFHTNSRLRVLAKGKDKKALAELKKKEQAAAEARRLSGEFPEEDPAEMGTDEEGTIDVKSPTEVLEELWDVEQAPNEWRRRDDNGGD